MDEQPTTFGLSPDKLAGLWNIGSDTNQAEEAVDQDNRKTELLRDRLAETLPVVSSKAKSRPRERTNLRSVINSLVDEPIEKLLQDPKTDLALIRKVKDRGKKLSESAKSKTEYHVANTIYYAAIATALVFHDRRITKFSYKDLEKYFRQLSKENWIPEALRGLFTRACEYCTMRQSRS